MTLYVAPSEVGPGAMSVASAVPPRARLTTRAMVLDAVERIIVTSMFVFFAINMWRSYSSDGGIVKLMLVASESIPFIMIVIRKPSMSLSDSLTDWLFGVAGTTAPLLLMPASVNPLVPPGICLGVMMAGLCVQISAKIVLGSSFGIIAANRGVKIAGPYRLVRHPMYAGYTLTHIAGFLAMPSLFNAAIYSATLVFQIARILREERILKRDPSYRAFADRVHYRLLPGVF